MTPTFRPTMTERSVPATRPMLRGAFTALVTPFTADGDLDEAAFRRLVRWQILAGIDGLVPCGTTGESPTLSTDERERLIAATVEVAAERPSRDRIRVVAGTGHQRHRRHDPGDPPGRRARRRCRARRGALLQPARQPDARGALPGDRRRGRPADRRLQRPVADRRQRRCRHVPAAGRASTCRRGQGGERQPRADRPDLPRPAARRRGPRRRRRLDAADPRDGRRRRRLGGVERDPGRARGAVRGRAGRRLGWRRGGSTTAGCRSSSATSGAARTRSR